MHSLLQRPIAFHPALARLFGGINEAIYWQQLFYWSDKGSRPDGYIYKTKEEIEAETTLTRDQQDRARKNLEAMGYLKTKLVRANGAPTLHYKVDPRLVGNQLIEKRETSESEKRETSESITESTPTEITTDNIYPSFSSKKGYSAEFEAFWKEYPRKIAKAEAYRVWKKANLPALDVVLLAISKQKGCKQWKQDGGKYIPHPSTWINQGRWDDEVEEEVPDVWVIK